MDVKIGELEDLFERYRSAQDLRALSKLFDLAAPELLRLAVHMAPDVASAEDLVQQTFLAAIEKQKRWRAGAPLLPWLFGILAKLAKKQRRSARRRPEPDRLALRSAEDPAQHTLDAETRSAIRSALEGLPELYREVVRASLFDGKPPHEIARELERAPGTVRMQLLRGLELLRRALPAGLAGGALVLCGTRGEAALKAVVLEKAAGAAPVVLATSTLTLGGLLVSTKALLAVVVSLAGLCAWCFWPRAEPNASASEVKDPPGVPAAAVAGAAEVELAPAAPDASRERSAVASAEADRGATAKPAGGVFLVGRILGAAPGHLEGIELEVGMQTGSAKGHPRADGSFEIDLAAAGPEVREKQGPLGLTFKITPPKPKPGETSRISIWARHPLYISEHEAVTATDLFAPLAPGERREVRCELRMRAAAVVAGRVRVPAGWSVEEADVVLEDLALERDELFGFAEEHSNCDAQGKYAIKSLRQGELLVRAESPGLLPVAVRVRLEQGKVLELPDLVLEEGSCTIRGRVDLPAQLSPSARLVPPAGMHSPVGGLRIWAERVAGQEEAGLSGALGGAVLDAQRASRERELRGGYRVVHQACTPEADGRFDLRGLEPGKWELSIQGVRANGWLPLLEKNIVDAPADGIVLGDSCGSILLRATDSSGPVAGVRFTVGDGATFVTLQAEDDGQVLLAGDLRKDYTASAEAPGREKVSLALPAAGRLREASCELRLADAPHPAKLVFRPTDAAHAPKLVQVQLVPAEGGTTLAQRSESVELVDGRYLLAGVLPGHWKIKVGPAEDLIPAAFYGGCLLSERFEAHIEAGSTFERPLRCEIGGRVRIAVEVDETRKSSAFNCRLASLDGRSVDAPTFVSAVSGEGFGRFSASEHLLILGAKTQVALQDSLPAGRYELRLESESVRADPLRFEIKAGETTQAEWRIELVER